MKKIVFVWHFPYVAETPTGPLIFKKRARKYCDSLNEHFVKRQAEWSVCLDDTHAAIDELLKVDYEAIIFLPGGQKKFWLYNKELEESGVLRYYLTEMELYSGDISGFVKSIDLS